MTRHDRGRATEILAVIQEFSAEYGFAPSVREIAVRVGLASTSAVQHHINKLVSQGLISRSAGRTRTLVVSTVTDEAVDILWDVMFDKNVGELDADLADRIGRYFTTHRRSAA